MSHGWGEFWYFAQAALVIVQLARNATNSLRQIAFMQNTTSGRKTADVLLIARVVVSRQRLLNTGQMNMNDSRARVCVGTKGRERQKPARSVGRSLNAGQRDNGAAARG